VAKDEAAYSAGYAQAQADTANRVNSPAPAQYEGNADYQAGYDAGSAQASDPRSYGEGEAQGRYDTVHRQSSMPPEYANPDSHTGGPGSPMDSYEKGYEAGASAPPYRSDVEAKEKEDREARERSMRNSMPPLTIDPNFQPGPVGSPQTSMSPITEQEEEAAKRYTEEKEANERYFELHKDWEDELKRTTPEDVFPNPIAD
jgi:hypothetical protein